MKQIFKNKYIKSFKFSSLQEMSFYADNQQSENHLQLEEETYGDNYYCYVCYHSLTSEKLFIITFTSDENEDNLNFVFLDEYDLFILDTGKKIYLVDEKLYIKVSFNIVTSLIGIYLTNENNLVVLEEASLKLITIDGYILKNEFFDLIENFNIDNNQLFIYTNKEKKIFNLV